MSMGGRAMVWPSHGWPGQKPRVPDHCVRHAALRLRRGGGGAELEAGKRPLLITEREGGTDPLFFQAG